MGNPLRRDDGVGPALVAHLERTPLPAGVEVIDGGTGGLTLLGLLEGADAAVLVDAAELGRAPGTVVRCTGAELAAGPAAPDCAPHHAGVDTALALGRELGVLPELVLFLVQPGAVELGIGLSPAVAGALPRLASRVRREAARLAG